MTETMTCGICGSEISTDSVSCSSCQTAILKKDQKISLPHPRGPLNDFPGILDDSQSNELITILDEFFKNSGVPVVVSIVKSTDPVSPSEFAFLMYNQWGIGSRKTNRGLLVLLALDQHHLETEVGLGLENILGEEESDKIIMDSFISHFKSGDFFNGLKEGTLAIMDLIYARMKEQS